MNHNVSTFKRYEKKYLIGKDKAELLVHMISMYIEPDKFYRYTICNIYYDTQNFELIRRSIEKPVYKEKLRLRSYGTPSDDCHVFFELKKKYKKEVFKRRVCMSSKDFRLYEKNNIRPDVSAQVLGEIEYFMSVYKPEPKVFIAYERSAFSGRQEPDLRITFDENIRFRHDNLSLMLGDCGTEILDKSECILEIKTKGAMPIWLSHALNVLNIFPNSFSKYGHCYKNYMLKNELISMQNAWTA